MGEVLKTLHFGVPFYLFEIERQIYNKVAVYISLESQLLLERLHKLFFLKGSINKDTLLQATWDDRRKHVLNLCIKYFCHYIVRLSGPLVKFQDIFTFITCSVDLADPFSTSPVNFDPSSF